jgi:hypothetical protein
MQVPRNLPRWAQVALAAVVVWDLVWKGLALWQAARRRQPVWFVGLLATNTVGVLPISYLMLMRRRDAAADDAAAEAWTEDMPTPPAAPDDAAVPTV